MSESVTPEPVPADADAIATSYVELTVAIVQLDARIGRLEHMLGEFLLAFRQYLAALEDDDATKH